MSRVATYSRLHTEESLLKEALISEQQLVAVPMKVALIGIKK